MDTLRSKISQLEATIIDNESHVKRLESDIQSKKQQAEEDKVRQQHEYHDQTEAVGDEQ